VCPSPHASIHKTPEERDRQESIVGSSTNQDLEIRTGRKGPQASGCFDVSLILPKKMIRSRKCGVCTGKEADRLWSEFRTPWRDKNQHPYRENRGKNPFR